jgi:hypothetical protein
MVASSTMAPSAFEMIFWVTAMTSSPRKPPIALVAAIAGTIILSGRARQQGRGLAAAARPGRPITKAAIGARPIGIGAVALRPVRPVGTGTRRAARRARAAAGGS